MHLRHRILTLLLPLTATAVASAEIMMFTDEATYQAELSARGFTPLVEDFEGPDWDHVRYTITQPNSAPTVTSKGLTWSGNEPVATNLNWARTGDWGLFTVYTPPTLTAEEYFVDSAFPLLGVGGWIKANGTDVGIEINGQLVADRPISGVHQFLGVIDTCGFTSVRIYDIELHTVLGADDFTFAVGGDFVDCNSNGLDDSCDLFEGTSSDCDGAGIPDECDIATGSSEDCDANGVPDDCELLTTQVTNSGQLSPIGDGSPQSFVMISPPPALADVTLDFSAYANLSGITRYVDVDINGTFIGSIFGFDGTNCAQPDPDQAQIIVPHAIFNSAVAGGDAVINMVASMDVSALDECDVPSFINVIVSLSVPAAGDANGSGVLDICEPFGDLDGDGDVDLDDYAVFAGCWTGPEGGLLPNCDTNDLDVDGDVDLADAALLQSVFPTP